MIPVRHTPAISGILLVTGTCIGAGMLALPVVTGLAGFFPAIVINVLCCLFMMTTGLLLLEAILWSDDGDNVLSLSDKFLGHGGKILAGASFLFYYYCLEISYCAGGTPTLNQALSTIGVHIPYPWDYLFFAVLFGIFAFIGTKAVDRLNWVLMGGLVLTFFLLVGVGSQDVTAPLLQRTDWRFTLAAAPTLFGAYASHNLLPSLSTYLHRNINHLRISVIVGTLVPFLVYGIWQWMIIGTLPYEDIAAAADRGEPITQTLQRAVGHPYLALFGEFFGFFALTTSFLGVSLSMIDFIGDGTKIPREGLGRLVICSIVFVLPAILAALYPGIFIDAIGVAGGIGGAILNGLLPIAMVWVGHHILGKRLHTPILGNKYLLSSLVFFTILVMAIEIYHLAT